MEPDPPFRRPADVAVLDPITGKDPQLPAVHLDRQGKLQDALRVLEQLDVLVVLRGQVPAGVVDLNAEILERVGLGTLHVPSPFFAFMTLVPRGAKRCSTAAAADPSVRRGELQFRRD